MDSNPSFQHCVTCNSRFIIYTRPYPYPLRGKVGRFVEIRGRRSFRCAMEEGGTYRCRRCPTFTMDPGATQEDEEHLNDVDIRESQEAAELARPASAQSVDSTPSSSGDPAPLADPTDDPSDDLQRARIAFARNSGFLTYRVGTKAERVAAMNHLLQPPTTAIENQTIESWNQKHLGKSTAPIKVCPVCATIMTHKMQTVVWRQLRTVLKVDHAPASKHIFTHGGLHYSLLASELTRQLPAERPPTTDRTVSSRTRSANAQQGQMPYDHSQINVCDHCYRAVSLKNNREAHIPKLALASPHLDPGPLPPLPELFPAERLAISIYITHGAIIKLSSGQFATKSNVVCFPSRYFHCPGY